MSIDGIGEESLLRMMETKGREESVEERRKKAEQEKEQLKILLEEHLAYEDSYHVRDILISFAVFAVF